VFPLALCGTHTHSALSHFVDPFHYGPLAHAPENRRLASERSVALAAANFVACIDVHPKNDTASYDQLPRMSIRLGIYALNRRESNYADLDANVSNWFGQAAGESGRAIARPGWVAPGALRR
jgi:hypothetical protein